MSPFARCAIRSHLLLILAQPASPHPDDQS
jgi:hypothetical protein